MAMGQVMIEGLIHCSKNFVSGFIQQMKRLQKCKCIVINVQLYSEGIRTNNYL